MDLFSQLNVIAENTRPKREKVYPNLAKGNKAQVSRTHEKYARHLKDWTRTADFEARMGGATTVYNTTLRKYFARGILERRPAGGTQQYVRNVGWEWRWKGLPNGS